MPDAALAADLLVVRIRQGDDDAWSELIALYEGRLLAFVESRIGRRGEAEDLVQEAFIGFLRSLPNYDGRRELENYLFSICAHKLTDYLRRTGRRPTLPLVNNRDDSSSNWDLPGPDRPASSIARSGERRAFEETAIANALRDQAAKWRERHEWWKLMCAELLFVRGWANKNAATELGVSEQQVANFKFDFVERMRKLVRSQGLPEAVFPELAQS